MRFRTKRFLVYVCIGFYLFFGGLEYALILPSAWSYLEELGVTEEYLLGLTISGYSLTGTIAGLIGGRIADLYPAKTRVVVLVCSFVMIIGNVQYMFGYSFANILCSRVVCGVGSGAGAAILADVCRTTTPRERTAVLSICNGARQIGLLIGPAFQLVLIHFEFQLGNFKVTPRNAPGLFLAVLWTIFFIVAIFLYHSVYAEYRYEILRKLPREERPELSFMSWSMSKDYGTVGNAPKAKRKLFDSATIAGGLASGLKARGDQPPEEEYTQDAIKEIPDFETNLFSSGEQALEALEEGDLDAAPLLGVIPRDWILVENQHVVKHHDLAIPTWKTYYDEFLHDDVVVLTSLICILFFCQVSFETTVPPAMQEHFNYGSYETSLLFMVGGLCSISIYTLVALCSSKLRDSFLLLTGFGLEIVGFTWLLIWVPYLQKGDRSGFPHFATGFLLLYCGFPMASIGASALFSKVIKENVQGVGQGLRRMATFVGLIIGPLWGGSTIHLPFVEFSVPLAILILLLSLFLVSYKKIWKGENASYLSMVTPQMSRVGSRVMQETKT